MTVHWIYIVLIHVVFVNSYSVHVETSLEQSSDGTMLEPVFKCVVDHPQNGVMYDVQWFIGNDLIPKAGSYNVTNQTMNTSSLKTDHWADNYSLNFNVSCSVTIKNATSGNTVYNNTSSPYFAGITSESSEIVVKESEQVEIRLTNSVPLSCPTSLNDSMKQGSCKLPVNIWTTAEKYRERCRNGLLMEDLLIDSLQCAVTFEFNESGNSSIVFNVTGYTDGMINYQNRTSRIHFNVSNYHYDRHGIWRNISIPEIKATVVDRDYLVDWKLCTSYNDPHMTTFDGKTWENHRPGEFVMYRHQHLPYSVNVLFSSCVAGYATCNCGVAVRSNLSLYVVRTCAQVSSTQTELLTFPYENLTLNRTTDLHVSKLGRLYEATFPTGTKVSFDLSYDDTWISSVRVRASVSDIDATEGLCGLINGDQSDDFIPKQENNSTDEQTFLLSWRVPLKSNESLFSKQPKLSPNLNRREYEMYSLCTSIPNDTSSEVVLNTSVPSMLCTEDNSITTNLSLLSDKTTEAGFTEDLSYDPNYSETDTPQVSVWRNGWTESTARTFCQNSFNTDLAVNECQTLTKIDSSSYIESCIADIKLSGNTTYLQDTMNTFKGACYQEVTHDEVYYVNRTTDGRFLADIIFSVLCPRDCSGNGNCTNGNCDCFSGFIGSDCSIQLSSPLEGFRLPFDGLCDSSAPGSCQTFFVIGFFHSDVIFVKLSIFVIFTNNSVINTLESFTHATYHHYNLIALDISLDSLGNNTGAAIGCYVTLSYDGSTYGDPQILLIYDKNMYDCNRETLECTSKAQEEKEPSDSDNLVLIAILVTVMSVLSAITAFLILKKYKSLPCFVKKSMITSPPPRQHSIIPHSKTKKNKMPEMDDSIISSHPPMQHNMGQDRRRKPSISFLSSDVYPQSPPTSHLQHNTRPHRIPPLLPPLEPCIISQLPRRQELNSNKRFSPYKS
ncbi:von Willebrand factor D and EGF domain-containing protein isoform X1 [Magallana gigas]|uniref:von Willebrand factor D and EGF domain-containing protein isoform X1 n=2 Tax=Magallana gigas TaxID=29159 RepID=UPI00333EC733